MATLRVMVGGLVGVAVTAGQHRPEVLAAHKLLRDPLGAGRAV